MNRKTSLTLKLLFKYYKQKNLMLLYIREGEGVYITYSTYKSVKDSYRSIII